MSFFFFVTQLFTLLVFEKKLLGYSLAIFQLSALLNIFLGHRIFREKNIRFKLIGTLVMVGGVLLIMTQ
jgi:drug/metabolite transporter (DMT)-like permease